MIHPYLQWISAVYHYPVQYPDDTLSRDIQIDFYRQNLTVKIIHHVEGSETSAKDECIVHKVNGPALIQCSRSGQPSLIRRKQVLFFFATKIQYYQSVNPVHTYDSGDYLTCETSKTVSQITFCYFGQRTEHRFIPVDTDWQVYTVLFSNNVLYA